MRFWYPKNSLIIVWLTAQVMLPRKIKNTVHTCIILHDIILKDEGLRICLFHKNGEECVEVNEYTLNNFCCIETHNNL